MRVVLAVLLVAVMASCTSSRAATYPELHGARIEVVGAWSGIERQHFESVLRRFTSRTGASVAYTPAHDRVPAVLDARVAAGDPPDVAVLPQPGLLQQYAKAGRLVPLAADTAAVVHREYASVWRHLASVEGRQYGVWFKAANKSLLWYDIGAFEKLGIAPPSDLVGLLRAAEQMRSSGTPAFSVGAASQWVLDDWFANLYLQIAGPQSYDMLSRHQLPWTDPSVAQTLQAMTVLLRPDDLLGGLSTTLQSDFDHSVAAAFGPPSGAAMVYEGDFVAGALPSTVRVGVDVDAVPFPAASARSVVGGGDVAVELRRSPAADALMRYFADPAAAAIWAAAGGFLSPNQDLDLGAYHDELTRTIARTLIEAGNDFRFGLADLQPTAFGSTADAGMQGALRDFLRTGDIPATTARLEADATVAYAGGR